MYNHLTLGIVKTNAFTKQQRKEIVKKTGAVIVAAGMSRRMKAFKPSLPFGDSNVANYTIYKLKKLNIDPITIVVGHKHKELKESINRDDIRYVMNENYNDTEMFDSVILGVEDIASMCDRILIMPMDLPAILESTIEKVLSIDAGMVRTTFKGEPGHPIVITSEFAMTLKNYKGDNGLRGAMEASDIPITSIDVDDAAVQFDIDTPEEYQRLIEWNYERGEGYPISPEVEVKLKAKEIFFDKRAFKLLRNIKKCKSLQKACAETDISYSKGSRMIKEIEWELGFPIVEKWTGGSSGGGTSITEEGEELLDTYEKFIDEVIAATEKSYKKYFSKGIRK